MSNVLIDENTMTGIANAIRTKKETTDTYLPNEMAAAVLTIDGGGSGMINYSTEEQVIGTWIDGKPLYQITMSITLGDDYSGSGQSFTFDIANVDRVISFHGGCYRDDNMFIPFNSNRCDGTYSTNWQMLAMWVGKSSISAFNRISDLRNKNGWVTLQYTKTTD